MGIVFWAFEMVQVVSRGADQCRKTSRFCKFRASEGAQLWMQSQKSALRSTDGSGATTPPPPTVACILTAPLCWCGIQLAIVSSSARDACLDVIAHTPRDCVAPALHKPRFLRAWFLRAVRLVEHCPHTPSSFPRVVGAYPYVCARAGSIWCGGCSGVVLAAHPTHRCAARILRVLYGFG